MALNPPLTWFLEQSLGWSWEVTPFPPEAEPPDSKDSATVHPGLCLQPGNHDFSLPFFTAVPAGPQNKSARKPSSADNGDPGMVGHLGAKGSAIRLGSAPESMEFGLFLGLHFSHPLNDESRDCAWNISESLWGSPRPSILSDPYLNSQLVMKLTVQRWLGAAPILQGKEKLEISVLIPNPLRPSQFPWIKKVLKGCMKQFS